jgi:O-methyltransferase involved in polyketide biosynthesis
MVPRVLRRVREHGPFDLILAGGLFDYLSDKMIARTLSDAWSMLAPEGRIVFTNIATGNPFRVWIEYMGDWKLIERSEEDVASLCRLAGVPPAIMMRKRHPWRSWRHSRRTISSPRVPNSRSMWRDRRNARPAPEATNPDSTSASLSTSSPPAAATCGWKRNRRGTWW